MSHNRLERFLSKRRRRHESFTGRIPKPENISTPEPVSPIRRIISRRFKHRQETINRGNKNAST